MNNGEARREDRPRATLQSASVAAVTSYHGNRLSPGREGQPPHLLRNNDDCQLNRIGAVLDHFSDNLLLRVFLRGDLGWDISKQLARDVH